MNIILNVVTDLFCVSYRFVHFSAVNQKLIHAITSDRAYKLKIARPYV